MVSPELIRVLVLSLVMFLLSLVVHEAGHIAYFSCKLHKKVKLRFDKGIVVGCDDDYKDLSDDSYISMLGWGVLSGAFIIFLSGVLFGTYMLCLLLPYWACSVTDVNNIISFFKKIKVDDDKFLGFRRLFK